MSLLLRAGRRPVHLRQTQQQTKFFDVEKHLVGKDHRSKNQVLFILERRRPTRFSNPSRVGKRFRNANRLLRLRGDVSKTSRSSQRARAVLRNRKRERPPRRALLIRKGDGCVRTKPRESWKVYQRENGQRDCVYPKREREFEFNRKHVGGDKH